MAAIASDLYFFAAGIFAEVAAKFLAGLYVAITGFVGTLVLFLIHILLLKGMRGTRASSRVTGTRSLAEYWLGRSGGSAPNKFRRVD
jgi:hypothetical protein